MNFKITKGVLLSSLLFTGAMSWNGYTVNYAYFDNDTHCVVQSDWDNIKLKIKELEENISLSHNNCNKFVRKSKNSLEILKSIKEKVEKVILDNKTLNSDEWDVLRDDQIESLTNLATDLYNTTPSELKSVLGQNFTKYTYCMILTALAINEHKEIFLEKISSISDNNLKIPVNSDLNAKKLLKTLFSDSSLSDKDIWKQMNHPIFKTINDTIFKTVTDEMLKRIANATEDYIFDESKERYAFEYNLNKNMETLYNDLNKIIQYYLNP